MNSEILQKLNEIIAVFEDSNEMKRMTYLKDIIYNSKEIKTLMDSYEQVKDNKYDDEYVNIKRRIMANESIKEYKDLENDLYLLIKKINSQLEKLVNEKRCNIENN